ncbi:hypothetical protein PG993_011090 [Apiospora rasikravindrae]|uniref:Tyrosinase copper-binding domain-containing protein n=1 Tax=Apiospora rasikravindrae TaxID=990691 RepID=A0ABR1SD88_9PEZI
MKLSQATSFAALAHRAIGATVLQSQDDGLSIAEHEVKQLIAAIEKKVSADLGNRDDSSGSVQCLMSLPANTPSDYAPGAKSRYDDFIVTHINHTLDAHYTGNFMTWHRWFIYTYETALRDECGYKGYQPPGRQRGLGPGPAPSLITLPEGVTGDPFTLPRGLGGGFVTTGPFANTTVNLGPLAKLAGGAPPNPRADGLGYNPRRLRRDVGPRIGERYANWTTVWDLLRKPNITEYRFLSEGGFSNGEIGPHGGGHYTINGDPGGDLWVSPGDPAFWVHHGNMDRMWTLWQAIDPENRTVLLDEGPYGHTTWNNEPPSPLTKMDDIINIGWAGPPTTMREMMSTTSGPLCYFYK